MPTLRSFIKLTFPIIFSAFIALGAQAKSCLWKVSSERGTLYLQGSIHLLKAEHYPLAPAIDAAYAASDALILEVDMGEMMRPETQQMVLSKAALKPPQSLKTVLDPDTYKKFGTTCIQAGLPLFAIETYKPWFAVTTFTMLKMQSLGFASQYGLDQHFYDRAIADKKPVIGLETVEFQINLFDNLSETDPNDFVNQALADLALIEEQLEKITVAWQIGDIDTLDALTSESLKEFPEIQQKFIFDRNAHWAKELSALLQQSKTHMVVVGAAHLPGKDGLLELLKAQGFKLEQL